MPFVLFNQISSYSWELTTFFFFVFVFVVLGLELRAYTLSNSANPFLW
jgi:NhaP-type Na+/H+ or K+/H+ antiporter